MLTYESVKASLIFYCPAACMPAEMHSCDWCWKTPFTLLSFVDLTYDCAQGMDTHSNILYVQENFPALSHLAHRTAATDKYRPETCCIIGNYYSLKAQHEKVSLSLWGTLNVLSNT